MKEKIQLYTLATPNGQKISIALEEMSISYDAHLINILEGDQFSSDFITINPNSKIPAIVDPKGPGNKSISIMESGAILLYLAEKSNMFLPKDPAKRCETMQWLFFQMGGQGPMFGQFGHFYKYAKDKCDHSYPLDRYTKETRRLLAVIDKQLVGKEWICGELLTIADFALAPWVHCLDFFYDASEKLELKQFKEVSRWLKVFMNREAVQRGMKVCELIN